MAEVAAPPRFSVVVPAYHAVGTLAETLDAVIAQRFPDWECVVVDDGSADGTFELARQYAAKDPRIQAIHQDNTGTAGAYNTGVGAARGDFIVMCSADDILLPEHLSTFASFIDANPDYAIYSSNGFIWHPGEGRDPVYIDKASRVAHSKSLADVIRLCFFSVGAVFRRQLFESTGGFRTGIFGEDYDFWLRSMALGAKHRYLPETLSLFRISAAQKSSQAEAMYRSDIQLVTELEASYDLSPEELKAVADNIAERELLIRDLHHGPLKALRSRLEPIAVRIVGRPLARRGWRLIKGVTRMAERRGP